MEKTTNLTKYVSPEVIVTTIRVEQGFATSGGNTNFEDGGSSPWDTL